MSEEAAGWEITTSLGSKVALFPNQGDRQGHPVHIVVLVNSDGVETVVGLSDSAMDAVCQLWNEHKARTAPKAWHYTVAAPSPKNETVPQESV